MTASVATIVGAPLDVIKTRIQNHEIQNHSALFRSLYDVYLKEGTLALYKGAGTKLIRVSIGTFLCLCIYESIILKK